MATVGFQASQKSSFSFPTSLDKSTDGGDDLSQRIEDFKHQNPEDVEELKKCIQDVLGEAEKTAQEKLDKKAVSCGESFGVKKNMFYFYTSTIKSRSPIFLTRLNLINHLRLWSFETFSNFHRVTRRKRKILTHSCRD
jgi:hypothetical protein